MRIIHCADIHLDSAMTTNLTREQARARNMEILRTFTRMVDFAADHNVRAIMIAGDLFDSRNVSATVRNQVRDTILGHPKIDFLYLRGNHDGDNFLAKLEKIPDNLLLFGPEWMSYRYGKIVIAGLELNERNSASMYHSLMLDPERFNIVMLHGQISGYASKDRAEVISLDKLKNHQIDYLALGHVHDYVGGQLDARGTYAYSGCLEGRGFDECDEHGFILVDVNEETLKASYSFVPMAYRTLYTIPVDVTGVKTTQEAAARMDKALARYDYSSRNMVCFLLTGKVAVESDINIDFLQERFKDYFYFEKVEDHTEVQVNYMDYEKDASLKGEFIRMVLETGLEESQKSDVIRCGIALLTGEDL